MLFSKNLTAALSHLNVHFDNGLPDERSTEEGPEWNEKVTTSDPSQIKKRIGDLKTH